MNKRITRALLASSLFVLTAFVPAAAQTYNYNIYIDSDNNASTGCSVVLLSGTITGAEVHLQATVNAGVSPSVTTVTRETCSGGTFAGGTVIGGGYPVGLNNGVGGASVVELNDTLAAVQAGNTGAMRLYVAATSDIGDDLLATTTGAASGAPILFTPGAVQPSGPAQPIPAFGIPALLLLVGLVVFIGSRAARRRMRRFAAMLMLISGIAWAGTFISDGQVGDWIGYSPIATDPAGDSTSGQAAIDLRAFFAATQAGNIFFRVDVANVNALSPPIAVDDSYTASSGVALNIAAPGVLGNDTLNSATISANTSPTHGNLTLNTDGSFAYTPTSGYTGSDSFTYTLTNSGGTSTATVTFTVVAGPVAVADSYTISVGTGLNISAPGVLSNDEFGAPPATMSSYGGGSLGGAVTDNTPGVAASSTLDGAALTLNADGSFVLGAPTTAGTYTFLYRIGNSQGTADGTVTVQVNESPTLTSAATTTFNVGSASSFTITSSGTPNATISESGALPSGVIFTPGSGGTATLSGTPGAGTSGSYPLTLTATNGVGSPATQNFTLVITQGAAITSASSTTFTVGTAGTFTVTGTGAPAPTLSESGTLPSGVTFVAATGILSGTPAAGTAGSYPITFTATNGIGSPATQTFTLSVNEAPTITSANTTTFNVGSVSSFSITSSGTPNATLSESGTLPSGVIFTPGSGGTATLSGTPAVGTAGSYALTLTATNGVGSPATQSFTLVITQGAAITSASSTTFIVGAAGTFTVTGAGAPAPTLSESGTLPSGVSFVAATGILSGTPAPGTDGSYPITFTATNGVGSPATQNFTLTVDQAPAITSVATTTFTVGTAGTFTVSTTGNPNAAISKTGTLPSGVTLVDGGNGTALLSGTPAAGSGGSYPITITANNGVGTAATQNFVLVINQAPTITSANATTFVVGSSGSFTVSATGTPSPTLSETGALPSGVTFVAATGLLSGTPAAGTAGSYPITFTANNGVGSPATQTFTLSVNESPTITSAATTTFNVGSASSFTITSSGTPNATISESGALPSGVIFTPGSGGTATLSGTPGAGTSGSYPLTLTATNGVGSPATQNFTLVITQGAAITSASSTTFTVGTAGTFTVTGTGAPAPTLSESGTLPSGVTFVAATGILSGTPAAGTGGSYPITFTATNGVGSPATQNFTLTVDQAPAITSAATTTFTVGTAGTFSITTTGNPNAAITETGTLPGGVTLTDNGNGTASLAGTPSAGTGGSYPITITANNGVGTAATQSFTLVIKQAPTITSANTTTFTVGIPGNFTVTASGTPASTFSETGALPSGVTLNAGTGILGGTPAAGTGGSYPITLTAANGVTPNATQSFTLVIDQAPAITSVNTATFVVGTAGSFTITTTGYPNAVTSETGSLPSGLTLVDNGNGTATLAGTPANGTAATYALALSASNSVGSPATQSFSLVVKQAPTITSAATTTFTVGTAGSFSVIATGVPAATLSVAGTLPSGVTFTPGTGVLAGTPAAGTGGSYALVFTANNGVTPNATQNFTLIVDQAPAITSANTKTFVVGTGGTFSVTTTGYPTAAIGETGTLPGGITLVDNGNGTATLAGTPAAGSGGTYPITLTANNGVGTAATQSFSLVVQQAPSITSANTITFTVGTVGSFTVTATGTPAPTLSETGTLPSGITFNAGTGVLGGTPAAGTGGSYTISFGANNGVGTAASQSFTLIVDQAPAITSANSATFTAGTAGTFTVTASGYPGSSFSETGTLPTGVTLTSAGVLSGTPATGTAGNYPITISANNGIGSPATQSFTLTVLSPCSAITVSGTLPNGLYQTAYSSSFTQTGGTAPVTWSATGLPAGLSINTATGVVSGSPTTTVAAASVTITVSDVNSCPGSKALTGFKIAPVANGDSYTTVGNTPLQVGGTAPATPYVASATSIFGNDSGSGTLTTSAGTVATSLGGSVTIAANGSFVYTPKVNTTGADTFTYIVTDGNGVTSAAATVTITASGMVWYVDGSAATNGNGEAATPFNTLASASTAHAAGNTIFVKSGATATSTPGAISLKTNSTLWGQGTTLPAIGGITIQNTAATTKPKLTGTVTLAGNTVTVSSLDINTGTATGFTSTGTVTGALVENGVTVTTTSGAAVSLSNAGGTFTFQSVSSNGAASGIVLNTVTGTFSVTGVGTTAGSGGTIAASTANAVSLITVASASFSNMSFPSSAANMTGVDALNVGTLVVASSAFANLGGNGVYDHTSATNATGGTFNIHDNTFTGINAWPIDIDLFGSGTYTGHIKTNTVGTAAVTNSGSLVSDGIAVTNEGAGTLTVDISNNNVSQVKFDYGINVISNYTSTNHLNVSLLNNTVHLTAPTSEDGITVFTQTPGGTVCVNVSGNTSSAAGVAAQSTFGVDADGLSLEFQDGVGPFQVQGFSGGGNAALQTYVNSINTLSGPGGPSIAENAGAPFTGATCPTAP